MKKHLQKYLFEEKVCNLVTEISSKETWLPSNLSNNDVDRSVSCYNIQKLILIVV